MLLLAVCLVLAVLCVVALLQGTAYERESEETAHSLMDDVVGRATAIREEIVRRGKLSDIPDLRIEAEALIRSCDLLRQEASPIERDYLIKAWRVAERIEELEKRFGEVLPVEEDGKFLD